MICARCAREVATGAQRCPICSGDPLLDRRYRLDHQLAHDSLGVSYRATRIEDAVLVRARSCMLRRLPAEPERSAHVAMLRELEHPALAAWLDEFVSGEDPLACLWTIHAHVGGQSLAQALAAAPERRLDEARVTTLLRELAELFAYLHARPEPVIHGSLTPSLIQLRSPDHGACLLDLGCASSAIHGAGSRGLAERLAYAAPEQLYADPTPASDIWTLGAVAIVALSGVSLASLRDGQRALRWRDRIAVSPGLGELLAGMLEIDPAHRISAAELGERLAALAEPEPRKHTARGPSSARARERVRPSKSDAPIMRPDELSRDLASAQEVASTLARQQRTQLLLARLIVVIITAVIAGVATYVVVALT
ncbi:MAG: serine/threonine-protein kinase [Enhygromyxa sp.]